MPDGTVAARNYVWLSEWQLENINQNHLVPIDFDSYLQLINHIAKALVPLLQIWVFAARERACFEKRYDDICQILNLRQYSYLSKIKEKLHPSLDELVTHGYLSSWRIEETKDGAHFKLRFYHGAKFQPIQKSQSASKRFSMHREMIRNESNDIPVSAEIDVNAELLSEMVKRGISQKTAQVLLSNLAVGQPVMDQLEWGDFQISQAPKGKFYNPAGFYIRLIEENITPPPTFESSRKRQQREGMLNAERQEHEDRLRLELAYAE